MSAIYDRVAGGGLRGRFAELRRDLLSQHPIMVLGGVLLAIMIACAVFAPLLFTVDPIRFNPIDRLKPPNAENWFGTDMFGRDVYSRTVYGAVGFGVAGLKRPRVE